MAKKWAKPMIVVGAVLLALGVVTTAYVAVVGGVAILALGAVSLR